MSNVIKLRGFGSPSDHSAAVEFIETLEATTLPSWFNPRQRILGDALVEVSLFRGKENTVYIHDIVVEDPGHGYASAALKTLIELADNLGVTLQLTAKAYIDDRLSTKQLVSWYSRHGFRNLGGSSEDGYSMERKPVT